jgi:hypothetical protein
MDRRSDALCLACVTPCVTVAPCTTRHAEPDGAAGLVGAREGFSLGTADAHYVTRSPFRQARAA